jgi:hypothetical protein
MLDTNKCATGMAFQTPEIGLIYPTLQLRLMENQEIKLFTLPSLAILSQFRCWLH